MKKYLLLCFMLMFAFTFSESWAQERTVSGKVTSAEDGSTLPGVNVVLKGTTSGTVTDIDGNYKLSIPEDGGVLVFSFIGLASQEVAIGNRSVIDIQMSSDITQLTEVVVTAQGIERKTKALGYSVANVQSDQVQQISEPDAVRSLQGKIPGVQIQGSSSVPGASTRITIRGNSSALGNNLPLFVVDGIPYASGQSSTGSQLANGAAYSNRISDLDPNSIASITVLKGGAAAALYGSRAANGVVLITTKGGSGRASQKGLEVSFASSYSFENVSNLPDYQNTYGAGSDGDYGNVNGSWGPKFSDLDSIPHWYGGPNGLPNAFPQFSTFDENGNVTGAVNIPYQAYPNNVEDFFETGYVFENSISVNSGGEKGNMSLVVSRTEQDGFIPTTEFDRTTISLGGRSILDNGLIAGGNFSYTQTNQVGPPLSGNAVGATSLTSRLLWLNRAWPINDFDVLPFTDPTNGNNAFPIGADNPYWTLNNSRFSSEVHRFVGNVNFSYDFTDWLTASYKVGVNQYTDNRFQTVAAGSVGRNGIGEIINDQYFWQEIESNFLITISKDLSEDIDLTATVGQNFNQRRFDNQTVTGTSIVSRGIVDLGNTANLVSPGDLGDSKRRLIGLFGDISLGYKDFVFLNLTGRNDWSSTLPEENRSFFYPAVSSSFIFTDAFDIGGNILTFGKLRAGWSKVGNDAAPYSIDPIFVTNSALGNNSNTLAFPLNTSTATNVSSATQGNVLGNPALTPEFTEEIELGTSLQFFDNRVGLDFTYYDRTTTDQIISVTVPAESGFTSQVTNVGEITNEGVEIGLDLTPISLANGFKWNIYGNFTHNKNKVVDIGDNDQLVIAAGFGDPRVVLIPGEEYGVLQGSYNATDDEGNLLIDPNTGNKIAANDTRIVGNPNPDFIMAVTNTLSYKGLKLRVLFDWKEGGDLFSQTVATLLSRGVTKDTEDRDASVIIPGVFGDANTGEPLRDAEGNKTPNNIQINTNRLFFNNYGFGGTAEDNVYDATVYRLREVSLSYSLPDKLLQSLPFGSVEVSVSGRNLWFFAPGFPEHTNFDPETNTFGSTNAQGFEQRTYVPSTRRFGVNLKVTL
ncbi:MAG: SusC/RagA family TonB-linked outer membrane protein [Fulvivirga sp.]